MTTKRQIRCTIYTRKSTEEGLEQEFNSLDAQREACAAYIVSQKSEGWIALRERYDDGGYSGGTLDRPALQRVLADIEAGLVDVVVVYKIDRLSRSLMDFAKLVEVFERKGVTFVSVTQSFNTTTSMGRLTLNVLLSFAQFERELTGERIRDKFAASRKKGIWMGGTPPLGYDIDSRKLVVNAAEAETVNLIFRHYLDLGCVRALRDDLVKKRIVSKLWTSSTGLKHGGAPFDRGALYCLLKNRTYIGQATHKGDVYPGEHDAIVPRTLFDAVQERLAGARRREPGKASVPQDAVLTGLLFDETGAPMGPTYTIKPGGRRYRYYISQPRKAASPAKADVARLPAPAIEDFLKGVLVRLRLVGGSAADPVDSRLRSYLRRIDLKANSLAIQLDRSSALQSWRAEAGAKGFGDRDLIDHHRGCLAEGWDLSDRRDHLVLTLPVRACFRGGRTAMLSAPGMGMPAAGPDAALIKAVARAHHWKQMLVDGEVASVDGLAAGVKQERRHVGRTLALAFLSPDLTKAILQGKQPTGLRLAHLMEADIPLSWKSQHEMFDRYGGGRLMR
jgi:DNA invertase Pin-like site-specific DNA recombinase